MDNIYKGAVGFPIVLDTSIDLTTATTLQIRYRKPDGVTGVWVAEVYAVNSNYAIYITKTANDLDVAGLWELQSYVEFSTGLSSPPISSYTGDIVNLVIYEPIPIV